MMTDESRSQRLLACLGVRSRFQVVATLLKGARCVSDLAHEIGLSQSCTTRHLQALQGEGIVSGERDGKRVMFKLRDDPRIASLISWALRWSRNELDLATAGASPIETQGPTRPTTSASHSRKAGKSNRAVGRARAAKETQRPKTAHGLAVPPRDPGKRVAVAERGPSMPADEPEVAIPHRTEIEDFLL